jgi:hypothetical protein
MRRALLCLLLLYLIGDLANPVLGGVTTDDSVQVSRTSRSISEPLGPTALPAASTAGALLDRPRPPRRAVGARPARPTPVARLSLPSASDPRPADADDHRSLLARS